ncbi:hypothetical protein JCM10213_000213 [Rhodosporidiobolus nylandii]
MATPFSPQVVTDEHARLEYARQLLASHPTSVPHRPLACFLFLLEALAFVGAADRARGDGKRPISGIGGAQTSGQEHGHVHSTFEEAEGASGSGGSGPGEGTRTARTDAGARQPVPWAQWVEYLTEVYLHPFYPPEAGVTSSATAPWTSPLHVPSDITSYLQHLPCSPVFDDSTRTLLLAACRSAITHLSSPSSSQSSVPSSSQTTLDMLMTEFASPAGPHPLPKSTVSNIALILATQRKTATASSAPATTSRQVVASLLEHYVSPTFRQRADGGGHISYAESKEDDRLVKQLFPSGDPGDDEVEALASESDDDADTRSIATGIREAHESIKRKEDKLRQLLGENWQQGPRGSPTPSTSSPRGGSKRTWMTGSGAQTSTSQMTSGTSHGTLRRQTSTSTLRRQQSFESARSGESGESRLGRGEQPTSTGRAHHHRFVSTSSSQTPLIDEPSPPPSPAHSPTRSILHRRGVSTHGGLFYAPSSLTLPTARAGAPPVSPAVSTPPLQAGPGTPFQDLAPAIPSTSHGFSTGERLGPPSPRRTSLDSSLDYVYGAPRTAGVGGGLPLNRNALSAHEKRELVRRSKKLEGFFGATFQEDAAQRVLVSRRGQAVPIVPHDLQGVQGDDVSPTNTSFPAPGQNPGPDLRASVDSVASTSSADSGVHRDSLAPPSPSRHAFPSPSYQFGRSSRRPSVLSHSSSLSSLSAPSPSGSPSLNPQGTAPSATRMYRSSSSPSQRSSSFSSLASPDHAYFSLAPRRMSTLEREEQAREREERRRKLEKVRRMLGERVPIALVCGDGDGANQDRLSPNAAGSAPMSKSRSTGGAVSGLLKGMAGVKLGGGGAGVPKGHREPLAAEWDYVLPQVGESSRPGAAAQRPNTHVAGRQVEALARARKLENLFGDLPPQSMYLSPASPTLPDASAARPSFSMSRSHRRSVSDLAALSSHDHTSRGVPLSLRRFTTASTADSYRQSLASLGYIAERDPQALDDIARVYDTESRRGSVASEADEGIEETGHAETPVPVQAEEEEHDTESVWGGASMQRSMSAGSHFAVRRAQKLAGFFGTTRGEVWQMLLNDIQASIEDDLTLDEDEREEVLSGVERLRAKARV